MALLIGWLGVCYAALAEEKYPDGMTILETSKTGEMKLVAGSKAEMDVAREPASTFKVVIALGGVGSGISPRCGKAVGGGGRVGVEAGAPEIDQSALCYFSGKVG